MTSPTARPLLVDLGPKTFNSDEDEPEMQVLHFTEVFFAPPVEGIISEIVYSDESPFEACKAGRLTTGQWLLAVLSEFRHQVNNGGIAQLLVNCPNLVGDIPIALRLLQMEELASDFEAVIKPLLEDAAANRRNASDTVRSQTKAQWKDYLSLQEKTEGSGFDNRFYQSGDAQLLARIIDYVTSTPGDFQLLHN